MTILEAWNANGTIKSTAKEMHMSWQRVVKELSTAGIIINQTHQDIMDLYNKQMTAEQIAKHLDMSVSTVKSYLPRTRPLYNVNPSENALRIKECRRRKERAESLE